MYAIPDTFIENILANIYPSHVLMPCTVAYIKHLFSPYENALSQILNVETLQEWVKQYFAGDLSERAISEINLVLSKNTSDQQKLMTNLKFAVSEYLFSEILELAGNISNNYDSETITPWDVMEGIAKDPELESMFQLGTDNKLPVSFTVDGEIHTHSVLLEFLGGVLFFSSITERSFHPVISGVEFDQSFINTDPRFNEPPTNPEDYFKPVDHYSLTINDNTKYFTTPQFIQGFNIGCLWSGNQFDNFINNNGIIKYYNDNKENILTLL